jgi:hypothetical protein
MFTDTCFPKVMAAGATFAKQVSAPRADTYWQ